MGAGIIGTIVRPCPPPVPPLFPLALIGGVSRGRGGPVRTLMRRGKMLPFLYAPLCWSYRPIRCSNGFRNHYQNYSPTTSPSRPSAATKHTSQLSLFPTCLNGICCKHCVCLHNSYGIQTRTKGNQANTFDTHPPIFPMIQFFSTTEV